MDEHESDCVNDLASSSDPRIDDEYVRQVANRFVVIGVVHDHPASSARARTVVRTIDPDVVAVELPPIAVSLFRDPDSNDGEPFGSEIRAAIDAADEDARVVGIDSLGPGFFSVLYRRARLEGAGPSTVRKVGSDLFDVATHALACRVAAASPWSVVDPGNRKEFDHDVGRADPPAVQAEDERRHLSRARSLLGAVRRHPAETVLDSSRERNMANNLASIEGHRTVVALVGFDHLDEVSDRLSDLLDL